MNAQHWWRQFCWTRLQLELSLEACAAVLLARSVRDEAGARRKAERLRAALDHSIKAAQEVLGHRVS